MSGIGVTMRCETKVIRRTWEMVIGERVTVEQLVGFLSKIPERAAIVSIDFTDDYFERTTITFEQETSTE